MPFNMPPDLMTEGDVAAATQAMEEIEARATSNPRRAVRLMPHASLDFDAIWARLRGGNAPKAQADTRKATKTIDTAEVWRRFNGKGPDPDKVLK